MRKEPIYGKCCFCTKFREAAETDIGISYGAPVDLYYCSECLGLEKVAGEVEPKAEKPGKYLPAKEIRAIGETSVSIVLKALKITSQSKDEINEAIKKSWDGYLRPVTLKRALIALVRAGMIAETRQRTGTETYRLLESKSSTNDERVAANSRRLNSKQIKELGRTPASIVLETISRGASTRKQINESINIRWGGYLRHELLETALARLVREGSIVAAVHGIEQSYYVPANRRVAGGVA